MSIDSVQAVLPESPLPPSVSPLAAVSEAPVPERRTSSLTVAGLELQVDIVKGLKDTKLDFEALVTFQLRQFRTGVRSLGLFHAQSRFRMFCLWMVKWRWFDRIILLVILANSVFLSIENKRYPSAAVNQISEGVAVYFTALFICECVLKIVGYGFFMHYDSYLRDPFNWLDFIVVISGILELAQIKSIDLKFLRVTRVLRPLRSLNIVQEMKVLVNTMLNSVPRLANVGITAFFLITVFAILGLNLFSGTFYRKCRLADAPVLGSTCWSWPIDPVQSDSLCGGRYQCALDTYCGSLYAEDAKFGAAVEFQGLTWCDSDGTLVTRDPESANYGITSFNSVLKSYLAVFQALTLEGWSDIMYLVQDSYNDYVGSLFFISLVMLGSFFIWNLALAVVWDSFQELHEKNVRKLEEQKQRWANLAKSQDALSDKPPPKLFQLAKTMTTAFKQARASAALVEDQDLVKDETAPLWQRLVRKVGLSWWFADLMMICIVLNVVSMCLDRYPPPPHAMNKVLSTLNVVFTYVFLGEAVLTFLSIGPLRYMTNPAHVFDGVIVITSMLELHMAGGGGSTAIAFRGFRLLRIFKLAKRWVSFRVLLKAMAKTVKSMGTFAVLLLLSLYIFTLLGMNFFANKLKFDPVTGDHLDECPGGAEDFSCVPRAHFDTFIRAFSTVFQLVTGENWNAVWYQCYQATGWVSTLYFLGVTLVLRFLVVNLFMAILMDRFQESRESLLVNRADKHKKTAPPPAKSVIRIGRILYDTATGTLVNADDVSRPGSADKDRSDKSDYNSSVISYETSNEASSLASDKNSEYGEEAKKPAVAEKLLWPRDYSFFVFPKDGKIRTWAFTYSSSPVAESLILFLIVLSSITLALDNPLNDPDSTYAKTLSAISAVCSAFFLMEMVLKWVHKGFVTYWRSGWNVLDGFVTILSIGDFIPMGGAGDGLGPIKTLRVLRAMRPLRMIARNQNLKVVVDTLLRSMPELCNILIVGALLFLLFGLFGLNMFKGAFYSCQSPISDSVNLESFPTFDVSATLNFCVDTSTGVLTNAASCPSGTVVWTRPSVDTPICLGRDTTGAELALEDYPSRCEGADTAAAKSAAPYLRSTTDYIMLCGTPTEIPSALGCKERFCPSYAGDRDDFCRTECEQNSEDWHMCDSACEGSLSTLAACLSCQVQCQAACACETACEPYAKDAASCLVQGGRWLNYEMPFDHIGTAMLTLFMMASTEGWVDVMNKAVDAVGVYREPVQDYAEATWIIFFVFFMLVGGFFMLNLCVGVIVDKFNNLKSAGETLLATDAQKRWMDTHRALMRKRLFFSLTNIDSLPFVRRWIFFFTSSTFFDTFITTCILANTVVMAMNQFPSPSYTTLLNSLNLAFSLVFIFEAAVKLYAIRWNYFADDWNRFDFFSVCLTVVSLILELTDTASLGGVLGTIRLLRIARLFRLVRFLRGLNQVFTAFFVSLPKLMNVLILLVLLLFLFSVLGMHLFAKTMFFGQLDDHANFRSFYRSLVSLCRFMTGETWTYFMKDLGTDQSVFGYVLHTPCLASFDVTGDNFASLTERCLIDQPVQCGTPWLATLFMMLFVTLISYTTLNLFIAVVLDGFNDAKDRNEGEIISRCIDCWRDFDPLLEMEVDLDRTVLFLESVVSEVTRESKSKRRQFLEKRHATAMQLQVPIYSLISLDFALSTKLKTTTAGTIRFIDAVRCALRLLVAARNPKLLQEIDALEDLPKARSEVGRLFDLHNSRLRRLHEVKKVAPGEAGPETDDIKIPHTPFFRQNSFTGDFFEHVAAAKIQLLLRKKNERRIQERAVESSLNF